MKVRVDFIEEELSECEGARLEVAGELVAITNIKLLQDKEGHRGQAVVVGVDVRHPPIPNARQDEGNYKNIVRVKVIIYPLGGIVSLIILY